MFRSLGYDISTTILKTELISRKPKRTEWGFLEAVAILNTWDYPFQLYRTIVVQALIDNADPS